MPTKFNFENEYSSLGNNNSLYKNDENSLRFEGNSKESSDENHEKEVTTTKGSVWGVMISLGDSL